MKAAEADFYPCCCFTLVLVTNEYTKNEGKMKVTACWYQKVLMLLRQGILSHGFPKWRWWIFMQIPWCG